MPEYYLVINGQRTGPFPAETLAANGMTIGTLVWREGMNDWQTAETLPELARFLPLPPPPPAYRPMPAATPPPGYYAAPQPVQYHSPSDAGPNHSGFAIAGFVLSFIFPLLGLIFSAVALNGMKRTGNEQNKGLATAGLVISIVLLGLSLIYCSTVGSCLGLGCFGRRF